MIAIYKYLFVLCFAWLLFLVRVDGSSEVPRILAFYKATEYYHDCIPSAVKSLIEIAHEEGWSVTATDDSSFFDPKLGILETFQVIAFVSNSGDLLNDDEREGLKNFVDMGNNGILGIHGAIASFLDIVDHTGSQQASGTWPFFGELMGAYFMSHPPVQPGTVFSDTDRLEQFGVTKMGRVFVQDDEWYDLDRHPVLASIPNDTSTESGQPQQPPRVRALAWVDEGSYEGGGMVKPLQSYIESGHPAIQADLSHLPVDKRGLIGSHPVVWYQEMPRPETCTSKEKEKDGGNGVSRNDTRVFYTALGHKPEHYDMARTRDLLTGGLKWMLGYFPTPE